jgi:8-oxo-dGTP pyrophosphatase MutT (NUDIX family)
MENNKFCTNCNSADHEYTYCKEPKTSWGILLVKICNKNIIEIKHDKVKNINDINKLSVKSEEDIKKYSDLIHSIKFLLISRKHSLAFVEFVRGRYKEDNFNGIKGLFELMMSDEINIIKNNDFDTIWNNFWTDHEYKSKLKGEYYESKNKFNKLKYKNNGLKVGLDFYTEKITPHYNIQEWGIPKGRKKFGESDLNCAIREFTEETQIKESEIRILSHIEPLVENMQGTDGKQYRHIYYIAELISDTVNLKISNSEVQNIGFFSYFDACNIIRPYHTKKRIILESVMNYYLSLFIN